MNCNKDKGCNDKKKQRVYVNNIYVDGDCCDELCEQVEVNTNDIAGLKEKVTVNEQNIADNAKDIQKNSTDIANLEPRVSKNEDDIEELQNRADAAEEKISLSENKIILNEGNIINLINKTDGMEGDITGLTERVENNEAGIGFLRDGLEETNTNIVVLGDRVSDNKSDIDALDVRVDVAEEGIMERYTKTEVNTLLDNKVQIVTGKGLSSNDYTNDEKTKLAGIAIGANKTTVENLLTSTSTTNALSATQGKVLNEGKLNKTPSSVTFDVKTYQWETGYYYTGPLSTGLPYADNWRIHCMKDAVDIVLMAYPTAINKNPYVCYYKGNDKIWYDWKQIVTAEPSTKNPLPLVTGISSYQESYYYKDNFGKIKVVMGIKKATAFTYNEVVAELPTGFRPSAGFERPAILGSATTGGSKVGTTVSVNANGKISVTTDTYASISAGYLWTEFEF